MVHCYVPLLMVLPARAKALAETSAWPADLRHLGMAAIGALGLARAYRGTFASIGAAKRRRPPAATLARAIRTTCTDRRILLEPASPLVPEEAAAVALASLRSCRARRK